MAQPQDLLAYADAQRAAKELAGFIINGMTFATDPTSRADLDGASNMVDKNPSFSTQWKIAIGQWINLNPTQIIAAAQAIGNYIAALYALDKQIDDRINARPPTIINRAQIDAAFAAVNNQITL
jgi:hypothetical protein